MVSATFAALLLVTVPLVVFGKREHSLEKQAQFDASGDKNHLVVSKDDLLTVKNPFPTHSSPVQPVITTVLEGEQQEKDKTAEVQSLLAQKSKEPDPSVLKNRTWNLGEGGTCPRSKRGFGEYCQCQCPQCKLGDTSCTCDYYNEHMCLCGGPDVGTQKDQAVCVNARCKWNYFKVWNGGDHTDENNYDVQCMCGPDPNDKEEGSTPEHPIQAWYFPFVEKGHEHKVHFCPSFRENDPSFRDAGIKLEGTQCLMTARSKLTRNASGDVGYDVKPKCEVQVHNRVEVTPDQRLESEMKGIDDYVSSQRKSQNAMESEAEDEDEDEAEDEDKDEDEDEGVDEDKDEDEDEGVDEDEDEDA